MKKKPLHWLGEHLLGHVVTGPIVYVLLVVAKGAYQEITNRETTAFILANPGWSAIAFLVAWLCIVFAYRGYGHLATYVRNKEILASAGLSGFWKHQTNEEKKADWESCAKQIGSHASGDIRILGVTGWQTFGSPESPLHRVLRGFQGEIKILLIKPRCKAFSTRARSINENEDAYEREIEKSLAFCKELAAAGKSIWVKQYTQPPIWKMIFTNQYLWLQYYKPTVHVDNTPVYTLFANREGTSLYYPLTDVFRKRWDLDGNDTVIQPGPNA